MNRRHFIKAAVAIAAVPAVIVKLCKPARAIGIDPSQSYGWRNFVAVYHARRDELEGQLYEDMEDCMWRDPRLTADQIQSIKLAIRRRLHGEIDYFYERPGPYSIVRYLAEAA